MKQTFQQQEKLKSAKTIENLFLEGKTFSKFPLKVFFLPKEKSETNSAAFAVPKRNFKLAVVRNRLKRQLREAYRQNKHIMDNNGRKVVMLFLFLGKEKLHYSILDKTMVKLLRKIEEEISTD